MTESMSRAVTAYEHCARLIEGRLAISPNVDGEATSAVARALDPIARQMRECARAIGKPTEQRVREALEHVDD